MQAEFPAWPDGADVAVALTFDVDGEAPWLGEGPEYTRRLSTLSMGRFGPDRGLRRVLGLLGAHQIPATFYVPGHTADHFPEAVSAILSAGHEVSHHGYLHLGCDGLDSAAQRAELESGLDALGRHGVRPAGYRSPGWELTPETLALLAELGFSYDASLMADDRPYWVASGVGAVLELPGHWSLCDWPYFGWTPYQGGLLADPAAVERIWLDEYESARAERRVVTYTMHPEAIGRGYLARMLDRVITAMRERGRPWFTTHGELAALARPADVALPAGTRTRGRVPALPRRTHTGGVRGSRGEHAAIGAAAIAAVVAALWLRSTALLAAGAAAVLLSAAAVLLSVHRGRVSRQQDVLVRDLWTAVKRIPPGRALADPDTGDLLSAERDGRWLTLAVTDPPLPGQRQVVTRYVIGHWGAPVRPPLTRHLAASDGAPPDPQLLRHPPSAAESDAIEVTADELAALVDQVMRTAVLHG